MNVVRVTYSMNGVERVITLPMNVETEAEALKRLHPSIRSKNPTVEFVGKS